MKSRYTSAYQAFLTQIKEARIAAGLTQQEVAMLLERPQSFISKIESGERRLDVVEFVEVMQAIKADPLSFVQQVASALQPKRTTATANKKRHRLT